MKITETKSDLNPLQVLILEDNPADAELIERELRRAKIIFTARLVEGKKEFNKALADFQPQVILSDFKLPRFNGLAALESARLLASDTPFIFVSGSIGEEKAIEMLARGASDYIFKDNLQRLGPAVKRVVEAASLKLEKKKTDEELNRHVDELRLLADASDRFVHINDLDEVYDYLSTVINEIAGADYLLLSLYDEKLQAVRPKIITGFEPFRETIHRRFHFDPMQSVFYLKDMRKDDFSDFVSRRLVPVREGLYGLANRKVPRPICRLIEKTLAISSMHTMGFSWENQLFGGLTVFFKKGNRLKNASQIEALVNLAAVSIKRLLAEKSLRESEEKYRTLVTQSPDGIFITDLQGSFLSVNQAMCSGLNYSETEFLSMNIRDIVSEQYLDLHKKRLAEIMKGKPQEEAAEYEVKTKDGEIHYIAILSALFYKDNKLIGFQGIAHDVTEKKKMEVRLRESEEYYRTLVETSPDAIIIVDGGGRVTFTSSKTHEIFEIPAHIPIIGTSIMDYIEPGEIPRVQGRLIEIFSGRSLPQTNEYRLLKHDRRPFWAEIASSSLQDTSGRNVGLLLICRDVSKRKQADAEILREKAFLEKLVEAAPEGIAITDCPGRVLQVNSEFVRMFGYQADEIVGKMIDDLIAPPGYQEEAGKLTTDSGEGKKVVLETMRKRKDGTLLHVSIIGAPIHIEGRQVAVYAIYRDISERIWAEEQIRASLKEKEVLLQEIHHRVKNNLQIISGLLTLQADQSAGKSLDEIFSASQDRIRSIALIHEKLYRSRNLAEIAFDEYLRALTENLFLTHGVAAGLITVKYEMEPIFFSIEKAIPLGLIVNELLTNALKHAFPDGRQGEIRISLHGHDGVKSYALKTDSGTLHIVPTCELIVADNGIGMPAGRHPEMEKTLGMKLVSMLAKQIQAELTIKPGPGTEFRLLFPGLPANNAGKDKDHGG